MWRAAWSIPLLLGAVIASSSAAQYPAPASPRSYTYAPAYSIGTQIESWRRLRQSSGYSFNDYASFLIADRGWPDEARLRLWAERAMRPGENAATVLAFFQNDKPTTGNGWARLADAYAATGNGPAALDAARHAWASADLDGADEQGIYARYGSSFTAEDRDLRVDALLFAKRADDAARLYSLTNPDRRAAFAARIAMQRGTSDAESQYQAVIGQVTNDAGLMMDRLRYLRAKNYYQAARDLAARQHSFTYRPADPTRFLEMLLTLANDAAQDRQWETVLNIAHHLSDALPPDVELSKAPMDLRDNYTSLVWLGGTVALDRLQRPASAMAMFDAYARAGRSLQVQTKGDYWAGRAAVAAGQFQQANDYFQRAAAYPELFYGQLALERLGKSVAPPPQALPQYVTTQAQRAAFNARPLVQAVRLLGD